MTGNRPLLCFSVRDGSLGEGFFQVAQAHPLRWIIEISTSSAKRTGQTSSVTQINRTNYKKIVARSLPTTSSAREKNQTSCPCPPYCLSAYPRSPPLSPASGLRPVLYCTVQLTHRERLNFSQFDSRASASLPAALH